MFLIFIRTLYLTSFFLHYCLLDSDIDDIGLSFPVQFIIDKNLLFLEIACLIIITFFPSLPLIIITEHLQFFVTVHGLLVVWTCAYIFRTK